MFDIRNKIAEHKTACKVAAASALPAVVASVTSVTAFAAEGTTDTSSIKSTMVQSFTGIGNDILGFFGDILPIALPILGAGLVISVGIGIFKKVTHKTSNG